MEHSFPSIIPGPPSFRPSFSCTFHLSSSVSLPLVASPPLAIFAGLTCCYPSSSFLPCLLTFFINTFSRLSFFSFFLSSSHSFSLLLPPFPPSSSSSSFSSSASFCCLEPLNLYVTCASSSESFSWPMPPLGLMARGW